MLQSLAHDTDSSESLSKFESIMTEPIAIIGGTGDQGKGLALRWARAGGEIVIGSPRRITRRERCGEMRRALEIDTGIRGAVIMPSCRSPHRLSYSPNRSAAQIGTIKDIRERIAPGSCSSM
jgi:NAD(P)-dependent dehydrogenase (short-subunit alcohol dehydrogenase family)